MTQMNFLVASDVWMLLFKCKGFISHTFLRSILLKHIARINWWCSIRSDLAFSKFCQFKYRLFLPLWLTYLHLSDINVKRGKNRSIYEQLLCSSVYQVDRISLKALPTRNQKRSYWWFCDIFMCAGKSTLTHRFSPSWIIGLDETGK